MKCFEADKCHEAEVKYTSQDVFPIILYSELTEEIINKFEDRLIWIVKHSKKKEKRKREREEK